MVIDPRQTGDRLDANSELDRFADPVHRAVTAALPRGPLRDALHGVWLGHPLHPLLTDLPIGFWTSAFVLDLAGGRESRSAADALVGFGVVSALPTAAAGLADWSDLDRPERRSGVVHALANISAVALYASSFMARRRGRRRTGIALGMLGATAATVGGYLGGHLVYRRAVGGNHAAAAPTGDMWREVSVEGSLDREHPVRAHLGDAPLAAVAREDGSAALFDVCSHSGGPLHEGTLTDGCLKCPWHGSTFRLDDGHVVRGPATAPQPAYELRENAGILEARRRTAGGAQ
jgi:nitrite reductase/ring-hydroxylating ferredoxin subunit/uncharacterized membrane protein